MVRVAVVTRVQLLVSADSFAEPEPRARAASTTVRSCSTREAPWCASRLSCDTLHPRGSQVKELGVATQDHAGALSVPDVIVVR
jgi:hypothetical protein